MLSVIENNDGNDAQVKYLPTSMGLLAPLLPWMQDKAVSEILINRPQEVFIEKHGKMQVFAVPEYDERTLYHLFQLIANENQQEISDAKPLLSGSLLDGSRVQLVLPPTTKYPTLSIRRKTTQQKRLADYEDEGFFNNIIPAVDNSSWETLSEGDKQLCTDFHSKNWSHFFKRIIQYKKTVVISGGTSSGKTTFLNACLHDIDNDERLLILEDTREIETPHRNQVQLLANKGEQGIAKVSMQELVQASLRLRPDRIIIGEIRGKEILDFLAAASTGHEGSMTSIHANNPHMAFMRMAQMYKLNNVPSMSDEDIYRELKSVIDIIIQLEKTSTGRRVRSVYYRYANIMKE